MARMAFVWGSNGSEAFGTLEYALRDAELISNTLSGPRFGFSVTSPTDPTDPYLIKRELDEFATSCREEDDLIIFFSGHGDLIRGELMLVLDRTVPGKLTSYLPASWVTEARSRSVAGNRLIILDCCHAGGAVGPSSGRKSRVDLTEFVLESKVEMMLLASRRLEIAREFSDLKGSFLTTEMCEFLKRTSASAIGLQQLMIHLNKAAQLRNAKKERRTTKVPIPFLHGDQQGEFYFTYPPTSWIRHLILGPNKTEFIVLPAFTGDRAWCIGKTPVTNQQYRRFVKGSRRASNAPSGHVYCRINDRRNLVPQITPADKVEGWFGPFSPWKHNEFSAPDQPVVCISFGEAESYATWLSSLLPSYSEVCVTPLTLWDIAAFGKDFQVHDRRYWRQAKIHDRAEAPAATSDADDRTTPYGAVDMLGNVWEWCTSEHENERGPTLSDVLIGRTGDRPVHRAREIRGGSYLDDLSWTLPFCPVSSISEGEKCRHSDLGFRVATKVPIDELPLDVAVRVRAGFDLTPRRSRGGPLKIAGYQR